MYQMLVKSLDEKIIKVCPWSRVPGSEFLFVDVINKLDFTIFSQNFGSIVVST